MFETKQVSDIRGIIDYFSAPNLLDTFSLGGDFNYDNSQFQFLTNNSVLLTENNIYNIQSWDDSLNLNFLDYRTLLPNSGSLGTLNTYINDINLITPLNSNIDNLIEFFPERVMHFENFELSNLEPDEGVFEALSTPDLKIFYPEPFVASPSFVHEDLWFLHILHFQHWLWFFFISLIMFFFISFVNVVRWCNLRNKPKRETRGVSRSKCADLITACVPVSWATAIIVTETVDAADYYDGFSTGEIVIGIRAYQWGWEYFYPKSIDLNYNVNPSYSAVVGKSLKYFNTSSNSVNSNTLWKFHQNNKNSNISSVPAHVVLTPSDNSNLINFMNLDNVGLSTVKDSTAFKKIQFFSKTNPNSLFNIKSDFQNSFTKLSTYYNNDLDLNSSYTYGMDRQHNYMSLAATLPSFSTLLDNNSVDKFFSYNFNNTSVNKSTSNLDLNRLNYNPSTDTSTTESLVNNYSKLLPQTYNRLNTLDFLLFLKLPNAFSVLGAENDSKQYSNPFKFALNLKHKKKTLWNLDHAVSDYTAGNVPTTNPNDKFSNTTYNTENTFKFKDLKSSNAQFLGSERTVRLLNNLNSNAFKWNTSSHPNSVVGTSDKISSYGGSQDTIYSSALSNWSDTDKHVRFANNIVWMPINHSPIMSNNPYFSNTSFDFYDKGSDDSTPMVLRSKEESAAPHTFNTYWSSYWALTNISNRFESISNASNLLNTFYFPFFTEYAEYDFRNWSSIELMEDAFWESPYSSTLHDEYFLIKQGVSNTEFFKKQELLFNTNLRFVKDTKVKSGLVSKSFVNDLNTNSQNLTSLPVFSEEPIVNTSSTLYKDFSLFANELSVDSSEEGYESAKYINYLYYLNYKNIVSGLSNGVQPISYTTVFDSFRADYQDPYLYTDDMVNLSSELYSSESLVDTNNNLKLSNPFKLRSTVKNAIVTYNAIQKVFRSRFDEGRSNARLEDFSNSFVKHPYITDSRVNYESLLGKNKESFLKVNFYNQTGKLNFSNISSLFYSNNIYFMDLPFMVSMKSDPSRYLWFDWQSRWSSLEISASSVSRYSLLGVPYSNKSFEYFTGLGDDLSESETYLTKLGKARKNYGSNWAFTPYFFSRVSNWYSLDHGIESTNYLSSNLSVRVFLKNSYLYWNSIPLTLNEQVIFTPTYSNINSPARFSWQPLAGTESFLYSESILADILSKREYLYRHFFTSKGFKTTLPTHFIASPTNPLLCELKNLTTYTDPINISSEGSRDLFYHHSSIFNTSVIHDIFTKLNYSSSGLPLNLNLVSNYLLVYFMGNSGVNTLTNEPDLYKNQYRPMKKGVSNMIKLHATGAVAMPIETRLHLLASSKDVIHSWAIPSAGIKIDCVPGYSSHRVMIFLVSGIFWGQCMEICGRFHHWMPIIVFFIKRDLFFLWCTHFMHFSPMDNSFTMSDRQMCDSIKPASFTQSSWVSDINTSL